MYEYATNDFVKAYNSGLDWTSFVELHLTALIEIASRAIDDYTNSIFYQDTFTDEKKNVKLDRYGSLVIRTKYRPIDSVASLVLDTAPTSPISIDVVNLDIYSKEGIVKVYNCYFGDSRFISGGNSSYNTKITYDAGYTSIPLPIQLAAALMIRNMLRPGEAVINVDKETSMISAGDLVSVKNKNYEEKYAAPSTGAGVAAKFGGAAMNPDLFLTNDVRNLLAPYVKRGVIS